MNSRLMKLILNLYPPYLGAGVRVYHISKDFRVIKVKMPLKFFNKNYFGTHFGGSMYSMVDPFFVIMLVNNLGKDYIVWDKSANIEFVRPGKGTLFAEFKLDQSTLDEIKDNTKDANRYFPTFHVEIRDEKNEVVAIVSKTLYIRRKAP